LDWFSVYLKMTTQTTENKMITPPQIPFSREAEETVLGSLLINPEVYADIAAILKPEDLPQVT
jgi:hypothetical protein